MAGGTVLLCMVLTTGNAIEPSTRLQAESTAPPSSASPGVPIYDQQASPALPHGPRMLRLLAGLGATTPPTPTPAPSTSPSPSPTATPSSSSAATPSPAPSTPAAATPAPTPTTDSATRPATGSGTTARLQAMTTTATTQAQGIDVADYQHENGNTIDWPDVEAAGYSFVYIKATEGNYYQNPYYAGDFAGARAAGMLAGAYAFATPDTTSGTAEADYLLNTINYSNDGQTLPPMVDLEWDPYNANEDCYGLSVSSMVSWIQSFVSEVLARTSRYPLIYTAASWWQECTGGTSQFSAAPLSVASYGTSSPALPAGWSNWVVWQFSSTGSVSGIAVQTDHDQFNGPVSSLGEFATNGSGNAQELPSPVGQSDGVVDVFYRGAGGSLYHEWYVPSGGWSGPASQGGAMESDPSAVSTGGGTLQVVFEGTNGALWRTWYSGGAWNGPQDVGMGPLGGAPKAVSAQSGVVDTFWRGSNNGLWHAWYVGGKWYGPQEMAPAGSVASDPAPVAVGTDGSMDVFWRGANGTLYDVQYRSGAWSSPKDLGMGTLGSAPQAVRYATGDVVVAWVGTDQNIWYGLQTGEGTTVSGPRTGGDGPLTSIPQLVSGKSGIADLLWQGADGQNYYAYETDGGSWSGASVLPTGVTASPAVASNSSAGMIDVFWRGKDGGLWHAWGFNGDWAGPQRLGWGGEFG